MPVPSNMIHFTTIKKFFTSRCSFVQPGRGTILLAHYCTIDSHIKSCFWSLLLTNKSMFKLTFSTFFSNIKVVSGSNENMVKGFVFLNSRLAVPHFVSRYTLWIKSAKHPHKQNVTFYEQIPNTESYWRKKFECCRIKLQFLYFILHCPDFMISTWKTWRNKI